MRAAVSPDRGDRPEPNHWLQVDRVGDGMAVHPDAIGAMVEVGTPDGTVQTCWRTPKPSTSSTGDYACHFGLGLPGAHLLTAQVVDGGGEAQQATVEVVLRRLTR